MPPDRDTTGQPGTTADDGAETLVSPGKSAALTLEPAEIDWLSTRTQAAAGVVLSLIVCLFCFWQTTEIGFLLDDLLHVDYVARAMTGDAHDLIANFYSNWGGSDLMKSYRPVVSLSMLSDYLLFNANAFGYHLTNLVLLAVCSSFTALISLELTGSHGNQMKASAAVWSGLLFALYPLHVESVAWIIGRVDLICTAFYLISLFAFMRYRLLRERFYLVVSLGAFLLSLASKEMAVTLPVVLALYCLFIPNPSISANRAGLTEAQLKADRKVARNELKLLALYFVVLALFAALRTLLLGAAVGGYGSTDLSAVLSSWRNFADKASLIKIAVPVNEELFPVRSYARFLVPAYLAIAAIAVWRALKSPHLVRVSAFLIAWTVIALLPTFQIWHIYPNLVGSRLFFLSSAPLCILIAVAALPVIDLLTVRKARIIAVLGTGCLLWITSIYAFLTEQNLKPWIEAGARMRTIKKQIADFAGKSPNKKTLLLDLPADYQGAGLVTRPQYLAILSRPPLASFDMTGSIATLESEMPGGNQDVIAPALLSKLKQSEKFSAVYRWHADSGRYVRWSPSSAKAGFSFHSADWNSSKVMTLPQAETFDIKRWNVMSQSKPRIEPHEKFVRFSAGAEPLKIFFNDSQVDPLKVAAIEIRFFDRAKSGSASALSGKIALIWRDLEGNLMKSESCRKKKDGLLFVLGNNKNWVLAGTIKQIGIELSGNAPFADISDVITRADSKELN